MGGGPCIAGRARALHACPQPRATPSRYAVHRLTAQAAGMQRAGAHRRERGAAVVASAGGGSSGGGGAPLAGGPLYLGLDFGTSGARCAVVDGACAWTAAWAHKYKKLVGCSKIGID